MAATCARAVEMGVPGLAFTEHVDHTEWLVPAEVLAESAQLQKFATPSGASIARPSFNVEGYMAAVQECRDKFPDLRILTGMEMGEPHWHAEALTALLARGSFDRLLGSLHCLPYGDRFSEPGYLYTQREPGEVLLGYLAEVPKVVAGCDFFEVFAHIEYAVRYWPSTTHPFRWSTFEAAFREALGAIAGGGRVLEVNSGSGVFPELLQWWREEGGTAISFGSDAHDPAHLAQRFSEASAMAEANGFRPGSRPWDFWIL
jgi:histidinol-phosphatase (PHP family)